MTLTFAEILMLLIAFLLGGFVKGVSGIGMPLITIPILIQFVSVQSAIAIMSVPVFISNLVPLTDIEAVKRGASRFKGILFVIPVGIFLGSFALLYLDARRLDLLIGIVIGFFSVLGLCEIKIAPQGLNERIWNPVAGLITGTLGGFSSFYGPPIALYFSLIKVPREEFIVSASLVFAIAASTLYVVMATNGIFTSRDLLISTAGMAPIFVGMYVGNKARQRISERAFNKLILWFLVLIAANQIRRGIGL